MVRLIVYSFAALMDVILSAALFVCMVRMADMHASAQSVASLMLLWAAIYMVASLAAGHVVTRRNAAWILITAAAANIFLAAAFILIPGRHAMYVLMGVQGFTTAFFFAPFQVFMKLVDQGKNKGVAHSTGLYTFAWSNGYAFGPFVAGYLFEHAGWQACHVFNGFVAATIAIGIYCLKHHADVAPHRPLEGDSAAHPVESPETAALPNLAWMSWVFGGIGCLVVAVVRSIFPSSGAAYDISKADQGQILFVFAAVQALVGLALIRGGRWMYRPLPILTFGIFGVAGLAVFGLARTPNLFYVGSALLGIYSGSFYFYFVFHSLVHPSKSARYVSINESVVGLVGIIGPLIAGHLADHFQLYTPYFAATAVLAVAILVQAGIHQYHTRHARYAAWYGQAPRPGRTEPCPCSPPT